MAGDVTLSNGRVIDIDLYKVSRRQWVKFVKGELSEDEDYALIAGMVGMTAAQVGDLPLEDFRYLVRAMVKKSREPLADPNSQSESSSASS